MLIELAILGYTYMEPILDTYKAPKLHGQVEKLSPKDILLKIDAYYPCFWHISYAAMHMQNFKAREKWWFENTYFRDYSKEGKKAKREVEQLLYEAGYPVVSLPKHMPTEEAAPEELKKHMKFTHIYRAWSAGEDKSY